MLALKWYLQVMHCLALGANNTIKVYSWRVWTFYNYILLSRNEYEMDRML
jgi:hypothetical protein